VKHNAEAEINAIIAFHWELLHSLVKVIQSSTCVFVSLLRCLTIIDVQQTGEGERNDQYTDKYKIKV
jgi:hypothetical protein